MSIKDYAVYPDWYEGKACGSCEERGDDCKCKENKMSKDIDALVAEKVMGWKENAKQPVCFVKGHRMDDYAWCYDCSDAVADDDAEDKSGPRFAYPSFSTDMDAAWLVVVRLDKDKCFHLLSDRYSGSYSRGKWIAYFGINIDGVVDGAWSGDVEEMEYWQDPTPGVVANDSAPMAICLAALKSVGVEI